MTPAKLRELLALAEARKARDLAHLEALVRRERDLDAAIAAAQAAPAEDFASGVEQSFAEMARRSRWVDATVAATRKAKAALAGPIAEARAEATRSLGKHRALEHLLEKALAARAVALDAKAEREAPPRPPMRTALDES